MTIDWYVWLTPLILLPIVALFVFVGCDKLLPFGPAKQYPNLQVKAVNLVYTNSFEVKWTFYTRDASGYLDALLGSVTRVHQFADPNLPVQPDVIAQATTTDTDLAGILLKNPTDVKWTVTITDRFGQSCSPVQFKTFCAYQTGTTSTLVWILSHGGAPGTQPQGGDYYLEPNEF